MRDYSCHTVKSIINAFEKSVNYPFNLSHPFDINPCRFLKWEQNKTVGWCMWMMVGNKVVTPLILVLLYGGGAATYI